MRHFARFLLIFSLLFTQTGGLAHGISHALADQSQDQSLTHSCELCDAYTQLGSALGSSAVHLEPAACHEAPLQAVFASNSTASFNAYASRAPPCSA